MNPNDPAPAAPDRSPRLWVKGDWNGLFGLGTNVLLNVIVLSGLCLAVVKIPSHIVYGRMLPALGIALPLGNIWYALLAWRLARREQRTTVTALPYGPSVPHTFIVVFVVMLPVLLRTGDAVKAWRAGLAWCFIIGCIVLIGAVIGPWIRRLVPRAAMLGALAGIAITFIAMRPAAQMWEAPWIAFVALAFLLVGWIGNHRMPFDAPVGLVAVVVATAVAWIAVAAGWSHILQPSAVSNSVSNLAVHLPRPGRDVLTGMKDISPLLASAIPLGVYNFSEGMTNIESAAAAGDRYSVRQVLAADGLGAIVGSFLGSPFPPAVYIGHPGWKSVGGRIGYSLATGVVVAVVCFTGLVGTFLAIFPMQALVPVLLYIGMVMGAQAFDVSPRRYSPALIIAMIPSIAEWAAGQVDDALAAVNTTAGAVGESRLTSAGVIYNGLHLLGQGAVLVGILLGSITCFIIDRKLRSAAGAALVAAALAFVGLINAPKVGWNAAPGMSIGYLLLACVLFAFWLHGRSHEAVDRRAGDELLFVTGPLVRGQDDHHVLEGAEYITQARAHHEGASIEGELFDVTPDTLLRIVEAQPDGVRRIPVSLEDGRTVMALVRPGAPV